MLLSLIAACAILRASEGDRKKRNRVSVRGSNGAPVVVCGRAVVGRARLKIPKAGPRLTQADFILFICGFRENGT